jgi:hypothetical protein
MSDDPNDPKKAPEVDAVTGPAPLGMAAFPDGLPQLTPGDTLKNVPEGYFHGSVTGNVEYWRRRAVTAEARLRLLSAERDAEKQKNSKVEK